MDVNYPSNGFITFTPGDFFKCPIFENTSQAVAKQKNVKISLTYFYVKVEIFTSYHF
jgi:hypothetical protein